MCLIALIARRRRNKDIAMARPFFWPHFHQRPQSFICALTLDQMRFLDQPLHKLRVRLLKSLLDERHHHDIAFYLDVFANVKTGPGHVLEAHFRFLKWLAGEATTDTPFRADVEAEGCVHMRLQAVGEVVEDGVVRDRTGGEAAREVVDSVYPFVRI